MQELSTINSARRDLQFGPSEIILRQGVVANGLYILSEGRVKNVCTNENGDGVIHSLNKPVDFLGLPDLVNRSPQTCSSVALDQVSICFIPKDVVFKTMSNNAAFAIKLAGYIASVYKISIQREAHLRGKHMRGRMAFILLHIFDFFDGHQTGPELRLQLRRMDLATLANMNTSNAIRILSQFSREGLITLGRQSIRFNDLDALERISFFH